MPLTPEQQEARNAALARGREKAAANRQKAAEAAAQEAAAPKPEPVAMPPIAHEGESKSPTPGVPADPQAAAAALAAIEDYYDEGPVPTPEPQDDFERFLAAQDAETVLALGDGDLDRGNLALRVIYETEQKRVAEEKKTAAKKLAVQRAQRHARSTAGLIGPAAIAAADLRERMNTPVSWVVNMPEAGNSGTLVDEGVRINGTLYVHGTTVEGTLAEYISYREIEHRAHENERQFQGRSRMSRLAQTGMRFLNNEGHA